MRAAKLLLQIVTTKPTTDKKIKNWPTVFFEAEYFSSEKNRSCLDSNPALRCTTFLRFLHAKMVGNVWMFEFINNQDICESSDSVKQVINLKTQKIIKFQFENSC